jgi:hypothetical protein
VVVTNVNDKEVLRRLMPRTPTNRQRLTIVVFPPEVQSGFATVE